MLRSEPDPTITAYLRAKHFVEALGFEAEIAWQRSRNPNEISESDLLRESAWVILCAGFRESVIRDKFLLISKAFGNWRSASAILRNHQECRRRALAVFGSARKIDAILRLCKQVHSVGFAQVASLIRNEGEVFIRTLPFMGPATSRHLAKNLGIPIAKPDRHLVRIAAAAGYPSADELCRHIATALSESVAVVDLVVWRYATLDPAYTAFAQSGSRCVSTGFHSQGRSSHK